MLIAFTALVAASCKVGPDFQPPTLQAGAGYSESPLPETAGSAPAGAAPSQSFRIGRDIPHDWWTVFGSTALTALITQAMAANPNLDAAKATLRQAQENALAARGGLFPSLSGKASSTEFGFSGASIGQNYTEIFTLNTAQLSISYTLDLFGGTRRQIEAADAQAAYQKFQLEAAYVTLSSNIVVAAVQEASLRGQIAATERMIEIRRHTLQLVQ
ncbi:MAG: TolC family protein, partial [Acetobacteraceae bacterium]